LEFFSPQNIVLLYLELHPMCRNSVIPCGAQDHQNPSNLEKELFKSEIDYLQTEEVRDDLLALSKRIFLGSGEYWRRTKRLRPRHLSTSINED
jgi:hypothetical protein